MFNFAKLVYVFLLLSPLANAEISVFSLETDRVIKAIEEFRSHLPLGSGLNPESVKADDLLISIGKVGYEKASRIAPKNTIIALFVPPMAPVLSGSNVIPVISEPSPDEIFSFLLLNFKAGRVGYLYSDSHDWRLMRLKELAINSDIEIIAERVSDKVFEAAGILAKKDLDAFLITKNSDIYTRANARPFIEAFIRKRIPVIATSKGLLDPGALAVISLDSQKIFSDVAQLVERTNDNFSVLKSGMDTILSSPDHVVIDVNDSMEKVYGIKIKRGEVK